MKRKFQLFFAVILMFFSFGAQAGIPTTDPALVAGRAIDLAAKGIHYVKMIDEAQKRFGKLKDNLVANENILLNLSGAVDLGNFNFDETLRVSLPDEWADIYNQFEEGETIVLDDVAMVIYEQISTDLRCAEQAYISSRNECKRKSAKQAFDLGVMTTSIQRMDARIANIDVLMNKTNTITLHKDMQAHLARIQIEQTSLEAESMKLEMFTQMLDKQNTLFEQRKQLNQTKIFETTATVNPTPLEW